MLQKNTREPDRPQMTILRMRIAGWITKAVNTHTECITFIAFPLLKWFSERAAMLLYTYIACLVGFILLH